MLLSGSKRFPLSIIHDSRFGTGIKAKKLKKEEKTKVVCEKARITGARRSGGAPDHCETW